MRRRGFVVLASAVAIIRADDRTDALEAVAPLATALSHGDPGKALDGLSKELRDNISALIAQAEVTCSVDVIRAKAGEAESDWYMEIRSRETRMIVDRRRGVVRIRYRRRKLESLEPASFFAPPQRP